MLESVETTRATKLKVVDVRDSMRIPTPRDDRAKTDHRNILGVVVDVDENQVQTKQGLNTRFCRNQFD